MDKKATFIQKIKEGYDCRGESLMLGAAMLDGECLAEAPVKVPLSTLNRHGLIAGATGTGKTKTLQMIAEELSLKSVPILLMDIKGDLSGIARPGAISASIEDRQKKIGAPWAPAALPVEFLTISQQKGVRLRATTHEFGPILLSKILSLNDTQGGVLSVIFKYCDEKKLPLLDIKDLKKVLQYITGEGRKDVEDAYGKISAASTGTILRKIVELESQGADLFFGEPSFAVEDLLGMDENGKGVISVLRLADIQDRPKLFSTFMLSLLGEIYSNFPEEGDLSQPKLVIFIDEAHLIFAEATQALLDQIETIIKLIRSKGVGIVFCTQNPTDIPESVLSQLGMKVQHALRAFTAQDRKAIKLAAENYPDTEFYRVDELLTSLGIGEALVTVLNEKGVPTPLAATLLKAPASRMGPLTDRELDETVSRSRLTARYNKTIDRESAYELLSRKIEAVHETEKEEKPHPAKKKDNGILDNPFVKELSKTVGGTLGREVTRELTRGILGMFGLGSRRRR
ncbi:MAG: helicase HerA-like domain-containing protein [Candidatus Xenobiia bacterium LiM19]